MNGVTIEKEKSAGRGTRAAAAAHMDADVRLSFFEKLAYGLGDGGGTIITTLITNFLTFFYTDKFGLTPALVGTIFLVLRVVDAISDPVIGIIADRTHSRWGQFRPFVLWTAVPLGLVGVLTFTVPHLSYGWKVCYAVVTYFALSLFYSSNNVPYCAMIMKITRNPKEIISCQTYRFAMCGLASFMVALGMPFLIAKFGGTAKGYQFGAAVLCLCATVMFLLCFFNVRERYTAREGHGINIREDVKNLLKNRQLVITFCMTLLLISIFNTKGNAAMYLITYILHGDTAYTSLFFALAGLGGIAGSMVIQQFTKRFEVRDVYFYVNLFLALAHFLVYFVPGTYAKLWLCLVFVCCFFLGFTMPLHFSMIAFADDYGEWKTGKRTSGMSFAFNLFFVKLGWAVASTIVSIGLVWIAYKPGLGNQTPKSLNGILLLSTVVPGILHLLLAVVSRYFKIDNRFLREIKEDLAERQAQS